MKSSTSTIARGHATRFLSCRPTVVLRNWTAGMDAMPSRVLDAVVTAVVDTRVLAVHVRIVEARAVYALVVLALHFIKINALTQKLAPVSMIQVC